MGLCLGVYEAYFIDSIQNEMGSCDVHVGNVNSWYAHFEVLELDMLSLVVTGF